MMMMMLLSRRPGTFIRCGAIPVGRQFKPAGVWVPDLVLKKYLCQALSAEKIPLPFETSEIVKTTLERESVPLCSSSICFPLR